MVGEARPIAGTSWAVRIARRRDGSRPGGSAAHDAANERAAMSLRPRQWPPRLSDPAALSDLYAAAQDCMAVCSASGMARDGGAVPRGGNQTTMGRELAPASARHRVDRPTLLATG